METDIYVNGPEDDDDESVDIDCPICGSDATYDDDGINCSNEDCPNSKS